MTQFGLAGENTPKNLCGNNQKDTVTIQSLHNVDNIKDRDITIADIVHVLIKRIITDHAYTGNNKDIVGNGFNGLTVGNVKTLTFNDVANISGFNGNFADVQGGATLKFNATTTDLTISNAINNDGNLYLDADLDTNRTITTSAITGIGTGLIEIGSNLNGNVIIDGAVSGQSYIGIYSGDVTFNGDITDTTDIWIWDGTVEFENVSVSDGITSYGDITFDGAVEATNYIRFIGNSAQFNSTVTAGAIELQSGTTTFNGAVTQC